MKYDSRFGDPFWNSSTQSWIRYIMEMMTSWALICHVWYLPPMTKLVIIFLIFCKRSNLKIFFIIVSVEIYLKKKNSSKTLN